MNSGQNGLPSRFFIIGSHSSVNVNVMKDRKILVVEDEKKISEIIKAYLEKEDFLVTTTDSGQRALSILKEGFALIILDLMLPDMDGEDICRTIREDSDIPVIMVTARSEEEERIRGLGIGADDYVVKPFSARELVARVKALLRRVKKAKETISFNKGDLIIDSLTFEIRKKGSPLVITPTEFKLVQTRL
jgi:DNA-binding response OmpR family regulator